MNIFERGHNIIILNKTARTCFLIMLVSFLLFYFQCFPQSISITILEPKDKLITDKERILVRGKAPFVQDVTINGLKVGVRSDGMFSAGLIIDPGKNLLEVKTKSDGKEIVESIRILRIIKFADVERTNKGKNHWARRDVISMATLGIVEGYPDNSFRPKREISREELATWLARAKDLIVKDLIEDVFFDVPKEHWRAPFVRAIVNVGYMESASPTTFGIGKDIKRGQVAKVVDKAENLSVPNNITTSPFLDVPISHPDAAAIYAAFHGRMIIGVSKSKKIYQPNRAMNRAEATILISRVKEVRNKLEALYDFNKGYDSSRLCKVNTPPVVTETSVIPSVISTKSKLLLNFTAKVVDLQGLSDISEVKIDLTAIGGPPNAIMYDDGTHDDETKGDGVYTLKVGIQPGAEEGIKTIKVSVTDKSGWTGIGNIKLDVKK